MYSLNCFLQYFPQYFQTAKSNGPTKASNRNSLDSVIMLRPIKVALHSKRKLTKNNNKRGEEKHRQIIFYKNYTFHTQNYSDHSFSQKFLSYFIIDHKIIEHPLKLGCVIPLSFLVCRQAFLQELFHFTKKKRSNQYTIFHCFNL